VVNHRCGLLRMNVSVPGQKRGHMLHPCAGANRGLALVEAVQQQAQQCGRNQVYSSNSSSSRVGIGIAALEGLVAEVRVALCLCWMRLRIFRGMLVCQQQRR
jgi:hypothetical protein